MNKDDFFDRVFDLANLLEKEALTESADELRDIVKYDSFIKTELFLGLRWHLKQIRKNPSLSKSVKKLAEDMFEEISKALTESNILLKD